MRPLLLALCLLGCTAALSGGPPLYRWVDERGVTTYGSHPPRRVAAERIMDEGPSVRAYRPDPVRSPPWSDPATRPGMGQIDEQIARDRERHLGAGRAEAERERLARCREQRRVDCEENLLIPEVPGMVLVPAIPPHAHPPRLVPQTPHRHWQRRDPRHPQAVPPPPTAYGPVPAHPRPRVNPEGRVLNLER